MKTIEKLCKHFNNVHSEYTAIMDRLSSYPGYYRVTVSHKKEVWCVADYVFETTRDFDYWIDNVILN